MLLASPTFAAAVYPDRWQVGRVRLHAHTLGHALLLQRLGNPYAQPQAEAVREMGALVMAAYVCSRDPGEAARTVNGWWFRNWLVRWAILWGSRHAERESEMRLYIAGAWQSPRFRTLGKSSGIVAGTDPLHALWMHRRTVMAEDEETAMHCPLLRARMDLYAWAEREGSIQILGAEADAVEDKLMAATLENAEWDRQIRGGAHGSK